MRYATKAALSLAIIIAICDRSSFAAVFGEQNGAADDNDDEWRHNDIVDDTFEVSSAAAGESLARLRTTTSRLSISQRALPKKLVGKATRRENQHLIGLWSPRSLRYRPLNRSMTPRDGGVYGALRGKPGRKSDESRESTAVTNLRLFNSNWKSRNREDSELYTTWALFPPERWIIVRKIYIRCTYTIYLIPFSDGGRLRSCQEFRQSAFLFLEHLFKYLPLVHVRQSGTLALIYLRSRITWFVGYPSCSETFSNLT